MNYEDKKEGYYANVRSDLINFMDSDLKGLKILEIGAGYGETLNYLKRVGVAKEVVGIELFKDNKNIEKYKDLDAFFFGDIQTLDTSKFENYFDMIILADVLEHITEPIPVLNKVKGLLKKEGEIIVSMPNIRHYSSFFKIFVKGNFQYEDSGIFDYTHMRFYCKKNMEALFLEAKFSIKKSESSIKNYKGKSMAKFFNFITFGLFEEFFSVQYFYKIIN